SPSRARVHRLALVIEIRISLARIGEPRASVDVAVQSVGEELTHVVGECLGPQETLAAGCLLGDLAIDTDAARDAGSEVIVDASREAALFRGLRQLFELRDAGLSRKRKQAVVLARPEPPRGLRDRELDAMLLANFAEAYEGPWPAIVRRISI